MSQGSGCKVAPNRPYLIGLIDFLMPEKTHDQPYLQTPEKELSARPGQLCFRTPASGAAFEHVSVVKKTIEHCAYRGSVAK